MRTLSTSPISTDENAPYDLDGTVIDRLQSLEQRIRQRLRFPIGTWPLDTRLGTESVLGYEYTPELAASVLTDAIREEGGDEVTGVNVDIGYERATRTMTYSAVVETIYGATTMAGTAF